MLPVLQRLPPNLIGRDFIVGDIHGAFTRLGRALVHIGFDPGTDRLLSVGDLIDRGPESRFVLDWLARPWFYPVRGNHEQLALDSDPTSASSRTLQCLNGGEWLLNASDEDRHRYLAAFAALPLAIELEGRSGEAPLGIVHADCPGGDWSVLRGILPLSAVTMQTLLWSRRRLQLGDTTPVLGVTKLMVGHSILAAPRRLGNVFFIDTGAYASGRYSFFDVAAARLIVYDDADPMARGTKSAEH